MAILIIGSGGTATPAVGTLIAGSALTPVAVAIAGGPPGWVLGSVYLAMGTEVLELHGVINPEYEII